MEYLLRRLRRLRAATTAGLVLSVVSLAPMAAGADAHAPLKHDDFDRVFAITTFEHRIYRSAERTPYPDTLDQFPELFELGGYRMEPPNEDGEWYARTYLWAPQTVVMRVGERVLLEFFGINGENHPSVITGTDITFEVNRGQITQVVFEPDAPGIYEYVSTLRGPGMVGQILVLE